MEDFTEQNSPIIISGGENQMQFVTDFCRYALPVMAFVILFKCFQTLLIGHPVNKTYGYIIDKRNGDKIPLNTWETSIGRSKSCDIVLSYGDVSRFHAVICRRVDGWYIFDTISKLGTFVNGEKIEKGTTMKSSDEIAFAGNSFVFVITDDPVIQVGKKKRRNKNRQEEAPEEGTTDDYVQTHTPTEPLTSDDTMSEYAPPEEILEGMFVNFHPSKNNPVFTEFDGEDIYADSGKPDFSRDVFGTAANKIPVSPPKDSTVKKEKPPVRAEAQAALYNPAERETLLLCSNHITLGRSRASDIRINAPNVSRSHALLTKSGNNWYISDAHSSFGTFVNGEKISEAVRLSDGDIISLSDRKLRFIADYK